MAISRDEVVDACNEYRAREGVGLSGLKTLLDSVGVDTAGSGWLAKIPEAKFGAIIKAIKSPPYSRGQAKSFSDLHQRAFERWNKPKES